MAQGNLTFQTTGTLAGLALITQINSVIQTLGSSQSGATDPASLSGGVPAYSLWADTGTNVLKQRNAANTSWISLFTLSSGNPTATPAGSISHWAGGTTPPTGWLIRDGSAINRTTYAALYAALSTTYGVGDGSTTFNIPDDRGLVMTGYKSGDSAFGTFGAVTGSKDATLVSHGHGITDPNHGHGVTDPTHAHNYHFYLSGNANDWQNPLRGASPNDSASKTYGTDGASTGISINGASTGISINSSGSAATNANIQPSRVYLPIIKY